MTAIQTLTRATAVAALIGALASAAPAHAAFLSLTGGTLGEIAGSPDDYNDVMADDTLGYFSGQVWANYDAIAGREIRLTFFGFEASYANEFWFDTNGDGAFTSDEKIFDTEDIASDDAGDLNAPLAHRTITLDGSLTGTGLLGFMFATDAWDAGAGLDGINDYVIANGVNDAAVNPNFFATFLLSGDSTARSGNTILLALDDGGAGPDDNHDDMVVGITVTPLPAAAWFLLTAVGGLFGTRLVRLAR